MRVEIAAYTTRGACKQVNEDRALINGVVVSEGSLAMDCEAPCCLAVFDGVSAGGRGCEASSVASAVLAEHWTRTLLEGRPIAPESEEFARSALTAMSAEIAVHRGALPVGSTVASTVAGLILSDEGTIAFNAGDSRAYRWRDGILIQLTVDHTPEQEMSELGITDDQKDPAGKSHAITRALGIPGFDGEGASVRRQGFCLEGDVFLACSDGLTDVVDNERIATVLSQDASPAAKARTLGMTAVRGGTSDNVTVIVAQPR